MNIIHYITACCVLGMICPSVNPPVALDSLELGTSLNSSQRHRPGYCERLCAWLRSERPVYRNPSALLSNDTQDNVNIFTAVVGVRISLDEQDILFPHITPQTIHTIPGLAAKQTYAMECVRELVKEKHTASLNDCLDGLISSITVDGIDMKIRADLMILVTFATIAGLKCINSQQTAKVLYKIRNDTDYIDRIANCQLFITDELSSTHGNQPFTIYRLLATGGIPYEPLLRS
jgi:hypothetical protein